MDYYLIEADRNINRPLKFTYYSDKESLNVHAVIKADISKETKLIDYVRMIKLQKVYHVFSDKIKNVIEAYNENIEYYGIFVTSHNMKKQYAYWRLDTLHLKRYVIENNIKIHDKVFDKNELKDNEIICIVQKKQDNIAIREDLAESILRRCPIGINLKRLNVK